MKRILLILITLNLAFAQAQTTMTAYNPVNPRWYFDANMGATWQQSDMKAYPGMGFGFGVGHYFYKKPGRFLSFAWHLRYLHGVMFGMGDQRSYGLLHNNTLNGNSGAALNYNDSLGYVFPNYRMEINRYALELMMSFNRLREKTGIVLNVFGGIGFTQNRVRTDQLDASGRQYNYGLLDSTGSVSLSDLNTVRGVSSIRQLNYESYADTYNGPRTMIMPSVGFELGYQFGNWFAMGIGHKITFALNDEIDGYRWNNDNTAQGKNDRYHYSHVFFRFFLGRGNHSSSTSNNNNTNNNNNTVNNNNNNVNNNTNNNVNNNTNNNTVNNNSNVPSNRPVIHFTSPALCPTTVQTSNYQVTANIYYISHPNQIVFKVNGDIVTGFSYSAATQQFIAPPLTLLPGDNIIELKATNEVGSDYRSCVINYQTTVVNNNNNNVNQVPPPVITVTNPYSNPYTSNSPAINITATILNINSASQISYNVNGVHNTGFFFNPSNGSFSSAITLHEGVNTVEITATNTAGQAKQVLSINYIPQPAAIQPPIVTIYNPNVNPYTVSTNSATVNATVLNVPSSANVSVTVNGSPYSGFSFNPATQQLSLTTSLSPGANVVQITGTNTAGSDSKNTTIIYQEPQNNLPPVVNFVDPNVNPYTTTSNTKPVKAIVQHVTASSQVSVKLNGNPVTGFAFISTTGEVSFTASLINGANVVEVKGTNPYGSDSKSTVIIYSKPNNSGLPPVVAINYPLSNPYNTGNSNENVTATVLNVSSAGDIAVSVNGAPSLAFTFNASSHVLNLPLTLISGSNVVTITATNAYGSDSKTTTLIYSPPCDKPVIQNVSPATNTITSTTGTLNFIAYITHETTSSMINLQLNGSTRPFTYDAATGTVSATLALNNGNNTIVLSASNNCGSTSATYAVNYQKPLNPPVVTFTQPSVNPASVSDPSYSIHATVTNVNTTSGVSFKVNGVISTSFTFNTATGSFVSNVTLVTGTNTFEITGTNADGTDSKTTVIVYAPVAPPCNPPVIALNTPSGTVFNTNTSLLNLVATVTNSTNEQITVTNNGVPVSHTLTGTTLTANINLAEGKSPIVISVNNGCAQTSQTINVNYTRIPEPPVVTITNPGSNPYNSSSANITIQAKIYKVSTASNVTFKVNGVTGTAFTYNPATNDFSASYVLTQPSTTFQITGTNADGSDSKSVVVNYILASTDCKKPVITWSSQASGGTTSVESFILGANISGVTASSNISVQLNGLTSTFVYSGGKFTSGATLQPGVNVFTVTASNDCGSVTETYQITYIKPKNPPVITITKPSASPFNTILPNYTVEAGITHVNTVSGVSCTVNGVASTSFTYVPSTGKFTLPLTLSPGSTTVVINAVNADGADSKTTVINYTPHTGCISPVITLPAAAFDTKPVNIAAQSYNAAVTLATDPAMISVKQNGVDIPFTLSAGHIIFNATLVPGLNKFVIKATNSCGNDEKTFNVTYVPQVFPPVVHITKPVAPGTSVTAAAYAFEAQLQHVNNASQISMTFNGAPFTSFSYNTTTGVLTAPLTLVNGTNTVVVSAVTADGSASDNTTIIYATVAPPCEKPFITVDATLNNSKVTVGNYTLTATVNHIVAASQVTVKQNGSPIAFTLSGGVITINALLINGPNVFTIHAANECGSADQQITINYEAPKVPVVTITNPATDGSTVEVPLFPFEASLQYVTSASQITMSYNGSPFTSFVYNAETGKLTASLNLINGSNSVVVSATTPGGSASDNTIIIYKPVVKCYPPVVTLNGTSGGVVSSTSFTLTGTVSNVTSAQTSVKLNTGMVPFTLSGTSLSTTVTLSPGKNQFTVHAINDCGDAEQVFVVNYFPPVVPPVVNITNPATSGTNVTESTYPFVATVLNVTSASQISVVVNGSAFTTFTYNSGTHVLNASLNLHTGNNTISVSATTPDGSDSKTTTIIYTAPCESPVVTIPSATGIVNVTNASYTLNATVTNSTPSQVTVKLNGNNVPFSLSGTSLSATVTLISGNNTLQVIANNGCATESASSTVKYTPPCTAAPNATFNPGLDGATFMYTTQTLTAFLFGVINPSQITAKLNGVVITGYYFNPTTGKFTYDATLVPGVNTFEFIITNDCGTFTHVYTFNCMALGPPAIVYVNPASYPFTSPMPNYTFNGKAVNVESSSDITISMDGSTISAFSFDPSSKNLQFTVTLSPGIHHFVIHATNGAGNDSKDFSVTYTAPAVSEAAPVITITNPAGGSATVTNPNFILSGTVLNIMSPGQLQVKVNGVNTSSFIYTPSTKALSVPMILVSGNNTVQITATNSAGTDTKTATINYEDPATKTMITICHNGMTMTIPMSAWAGHQAHGDSMGACPINNQDNPDNPRKNPTGTNNDGTAGNGNTTRSTGNNGNTGNTNTNGNQNVQRGSVSEQEYNKAIQAGDQAFANKNYGIAKAEYQRALTHKPGDKTATDKLKQAEDAIKAKEAENSRGNQQIQPENKTPKQEGNKLTPNGGLHRPNP